jgi:hypothetical protein
MDSQDRFWVFSGSTFINPATSYTNDTWRFDTNTYTWTLISGYPTGGAIDVLDPLNQQPVGSLLARTFIGSRQYAGVWVDSLDRLNLFGGINSNGNCMRLTRLCEATNVFVWFAVRRNDYLRLETACLSYGVYPNWYVADSLTLCHLPCHASTLCPLGQFKLLSTDFHSGCT